MISSHIWSYLIFDNLIKFDSWPSLLHDLSIYSMCVGVWHFSPPSSFLLWARYHLIYSLIQRVCTILQEVSTRLGMVKVSNYRPIKPWLSSLRLRSQLAILLVRAASFWQMADAKSQHHPSWCIIEKDRKGNPWAWVVPLEEANARRKWQQLSKSEFRWKQQQQ